VELLFNVALLYMRMAEGIREGKSISPDFAVAVKPNQLLDAIQKASDAGSAKFVSDDRGCCDIVRQFVPASRHLVRKSSADEISVFRF